MLEGTSEQLLGKHSYVLLERSLCVEEGKQSTLNYLLSGVKCVKTLPKMMHVGEN